MRLAGMGCRDGLEAILGCGRALGTGAADNIVGSRDWCHTGVRRLCWVKVGEAARSDKYTYRAGRRRRVFVFSYLSELREGGRIMERSGRQRGREPQA